MTIKFHEGLTLERWQALPWDKKILNIASELSRAKHWIRESDDAYANRSMERALELIDMTTEGGISDKSLSFLTELLRLREILASIYISREKDYKELLLLIKVLLDFEVSVSNLHLEL